MAHRFQAPPPSLIDYLIACFFPHLPAPFRTSSLSGGGMTNLGAVQGDGIAGIDSLDMAVMGRGLSHALGDQTMSMSIDDIGFSERG